MLTLVVGTLALAIAPRAGARLRQPRATCDGSSALERIARCPTPAPRSTSARAAPSRAAAATTIDTPTLRDPPIADPDPATGRGLPARPLRPAVRRRRPARCHARRPGVLPSRGADSGRRAGGLRCRRDADERHGDGIRAADRRNASRMGRHRPIRAGRLRVRLRRRHTARSTSGGASWQRLGQAQFTPTATSHVYARARHVPGVGRRAVRGIRRFRLWNLAPGRRLRHGDHRRLRRARRRGAHRTRGPDLRREPARTRLLKARGHLTRTVARRYSPSNRTA